MDAKLEINVDKLAEQHPRERRLYYALDNDGDGQVLKKDIDQALRSVGLARTDNRLIDLFSKLDAEEGETIGFPAFLDIVRPAGLLFERALQGSLAIPDFAHFSDQVERLFQETALNREGTQADYIPPLVEVDADQFGVAVITIDGQVLALGHSDTDFSVQSACKPFNYCIALNELGENLVHQHVGMEPSGQPFNARVLMQDGTNRPHNPLINAGAIMVAALIKAEEPLHRRLDHVRSEWAKMSGGSIPRFNAWMAQEESRTGDNNRALGYMMKAAGILPKGEDAAEHELRDSLELYFSLCSLEVTSHELATAAATLANNGVCPITQERVFQESTVRNCLTMMQMCGMYDGSGAFFFRIGLPGKSGVGGAVILVVPRLLGVCIWSPRLDAVGNSVRGVEMAKRLSEVYRLHLYDGVTSMGERIDPRTPIARWRASLASNALWAASSGSRRSLQRLYEEQTNLEKGDYDLRTPMHLAAAEGHLESLRFLLEHNVSPNTADRWGGTPLDDAELAGHSDVIALLRQHEAVNGNSQHIASDSGPTERADQHGDSESIVELLWAAAENDVEGLRRFVAQGVPISASDYDGRTALHLAAAEGQVEAVKYLLAHKHPLHVRDRWNCTPLDEARREHRDVVVELLCSAVNEFQAMTLKVEYSEIARAADFIDRFTAAYHIDSSVRNKINVVLDEVLSNIVSHGYDDPDGHQFTLELDLGSDRLDVVVNDDGRPFDPLSHSGPNTTADLDNIETSGLGIEVLRKFTDEVSYRRCADHNILTLSFCIDSADN